MFERYTEKARRSIFFARYEASQFGTPKIETEHLLLGILREDRGLAERLFGARSAVEAIREQIQQKFPSSGKISVSIDLPFTHECKRALAYGAEEAERLNQQHIDAAHLLLGLLRQDQSGAAKLLNDRGITIEKARQDAAQNPSPPAPEFPLRKPMPGRLPVPPPPPPVTSLLSKVAIDLTASARTGELPRLIGRERELDQIIRILVRRTRRNPLLIGEPGVGKTAIVEGLAERIAAGSVPAMLAERRIFEIDAGVLVSPRPPDLAAEPGVILFIDGLFDLASEDWVARSAPRALAPLLTRGHLQCIATGTRLGFERVAGQSALLASQFSVVPVLPPDDQEAVRILEALEPVYQKHHGVFISSEAIATAVAASARFLRHRCLPDRALDLLDDACAGVKLKTPGGTVTARDVVETVAAFAGAPVEVVERVIRETDPEDINSIANALIALIPQGRQWLEPLAAYLAGCTTEETEKLAACIRSLKGKTNA
jgi:ATP-dependent Clp protease ATP-binding subunit ClpC